MKYMILIYASQQALRRHCRGSRPISRPGPAEDFAAMGAFMESFNRDLAESGELVETRGLDAPIHTRRVQLRDGVPVVTDGPYAETAGGPRRLLDRGVRRASIGRPRSPPDFATCPGPAARRRRPMADVRPIAESRAELDL